ncbi:NAD(P)-binding protein [Eremomyces bilateralis CBS 781.70]|uniref:NAD(P)-binding protein n=1 Tax=Eremomyces bilateralis CBS 781.70 TaxID=1392243 RepID=A0A6G1FVU3_9PEZI|nr:NAD(P)-binding protein [Eremomyces bilateralis CBS 781.70]KAF1810025.1 NAD(P)-binding protein [Eremomyces bilateralis CBS 781.70]
MAASNRIRNVAIVGAGGHVGTFISEALVKTGKHIVTGITRTGSQSRLPAGVISKTVDYNKPETIVDALRGQDLLIITLAVQVPKETCLQLINAAGDAGVKWILPNEWGLDNTHKELVKDVPVFEAKDVNRKAIKDLGKSSYIAVATGVWYEWSLAIPSAFAFDIVNRSVTLIDEGEAKISTSTWPQVGRTVAALLSLPIKPEGSNPEACLEHFKNTAICADSFYINQKDMLESVLRVTGTKREDWTITKEVSQERYATAVREMEGGDWNGFAKMMYTRIFYPDDAGVFDKDTVNSLLGLPKEDLDEATKAGIERSKTFTYP